MGASSRLSSGLLKNPCRLKSTYGNSVNDSKSARRQEEKVFLWRSPFLVLSYRF
jgi:hypothetical protein